MGRVLANSINDNIISLLEKLVDKTTGSEDYAQAMYSLGKEFGTLLLDRIVNDENIVLASTVEDADYLGKGIIDILEKYGKKVSLTVFWNKRFNPNEENDIAIAPIVKEFHEVQSENVGTVIVIKSIISSSCAVRTNLTKLIEDSSPKHILIVAPVLLRGATKNLENEFSDDIKNRFNYLYFAEDDQKSDDGFVYPGIGGDVYQRLGFENQKEKNSYIPQIVKERRYK